MVDVKLLFIFLGVNSGNFDVVHRSNVSYDDIVLNPNVSPVPSPPLNIRAISEPTPLVKNLHIEFTATLKFFFISIILGLLILLLTLDKYQYRFISFNTCTNIPTSAPSCRGTTYRYLLLFLLLLSFFIIFDFYLAILLPREFFEVKLLTKNRMNHASMFVKVFHCCVSNISLCLALRRLTYLNSYPCEVLALWNCLVRLILCSDINPNPGPINPEPQFQNNFLNFMSWNLNSLAKDNFQRVSLIEAHNSIFNYDLISTCENSLNDSVEIPEYLNEYTFVPANNPADTRHGGVGLFYKNSLPVIVRYDLSFDESIVVELKFGRKKIYFSLFCIEVLPLITTHLILKSFCQILSNFKNLHAKIKADNPFASFFTDDFNVHSQFWWPNGNSTPEGTETEQFLTSLGISQVISEPTNFEPNKKPSCIDLATTDQPNLILDSGTRSPLDPFCHHQIIYCQVNFRIPPPPPSLRKIWHFNRANSCAIKRSMTSFPWSRHLNLNTNTNWQVKRFIGIFLNIMSNFIPNETNRLVPPDTPWITKPIKTLLNRKNRLFINYKKHGYKKEDKDRLDIFRMECRQAVETTKLNYLKNLGNKVNDPSISQKSYWKIIIRVLNKCRAPKIPPLLVNNTFILNCSEKAKLFSDYFFKTMHA